MAPKALKRPAAASAGAPAKRASAQRHDAVTEKCQLVTAAIHKSDLPVDVRVMLAGLVEGSLGVFAEDRQKYQTAFVEMIGETLAGVGEALAKTVTDASDKVNGLEREQASREARVNEAEVALVTSRELVDGKLQAYNGDATALEEAAQSLKAAQDAERSGAAALQGATDKKESLEVTKGGMLLPMKEEKPSAAEVNKLVGTAKKYGCEPALLSALPETLKKAPTDRGTFDNMVIAQLEEWFTKAIEDAEQRLAEAELERKTRTEAVEAALAAKNAALERREASKAALESAKTAKKNAEASFQAAKVAVRNFLTDAAVAADELDTSTSNKTEFTEGPMAAFRELRDLSAPQEKTEEKLEAAEASKESQQKGTSPEGTAAQQAPPAVEA